MRRSLPAAALLVAVLLALLPPASASGSVSGTGAATAPEPAAAPWTVADLAGEVDWAAFARQHRGDLDGRSFAAAGQQAAATRTRTALQDAYRGVGSAGATFDIVQPQRTGAQAQQYYDECDDGTNLPVGPANPADGDGPPPLLDLRSTFIVQSVDDDGRFDQTGFLAYMCKQWSNDQLGQGGITYGLYVSYEDGDDQYPTILGDPEIGPDFIVSIFPEAGVPGRPIQVMAVRTPSRDPSTWTLTWLDEAARLDGFEVDGIVPTSAIGDVSADDFAWTWAVTDAQAPAGRDWFPEHTMQLQTEDGVLGVQIPQFPVPEDCGLQSEGGPVRYTLEPQQVTPPDPGFAEQWYQPAIEAPGAWSTITDSSTGGRSRPVTVAVLDYGIDGPREDFTDGAFRVTAGLDAAYGIPLEGINPGIGPFEAGAGVAYENMPAGPPRNSDRGPHGTAVASLIGARGGNGSGIAGVDWGVRLMPVRVNDVNNCAFNDVVGAGIVWAVDHGADIVHISLSATDVDLFGGDEGPEADPDDRPNCSDEVDNDLDGLIDLADPHCDDAADTTEAPEQTEQFDPLRVAIDYALEQGVPVVAAAGNFGADGNPVVYPAAYPGVISVGATNRSGVVPEYSSTGRWLDLVAPGGSGTGLLDDDLAVLWELDRIRPQAGTSFAAPLVTGAMSLYLGLNPHIQRTFDPAQPLADLGYQRTVDDLRVALINGTDDLGPGGHDLTSGFGALDVDRMLDVPAVGGPLVDPARAQLPRVDADDVVGLTEEVALSLGPAPFAVLARQDVFADALAGAPLTGDAPLLLAGRDRVAPSTLDVMEQVLPDGAAVYLLGGEQAIGPDVARSIADRGYTPVRLGGPTRVHTAIAIAREVRRLHPGTDTVALARADGAGDATAGWADSITGGAWAADAGVPLLVTSTDGLHPAVAAALQEWQPAQTVLLGGEAALGAAVAAAVPNPRRVAGGDRAATAAAVADQLWDGVGDAGFLIANGWYARAWPAGLAAARLAADTDRPLLLTGGAAVPGPTSATLRAHCGAPDAITLVGGASLITGTAEAALMEAATC